MWSVLRIRNNSRIRKIPQYKKRAGILFLYDTTNLSTLQALSDRIKYAEEIFANEDKCLPPCLIVGCKTDLTAQRVVDTEQAQEMADAHCMGHIETSAKDNIGVTEAFIEMARLMINKRQLSDKQRIEEERLMRGGKRCVVI